MPICFNSMQTSQNHKFSFEFFNQTEQEQQSCGWLPIQNADHCISYNSDDGSYRVQLPVQNIECYAQNSPSTTTFSPNLLHSPDNASGSPISGWCVTENELRQLESAMLGPESDDQVSLEPVEWQKMEEMISRGDLKELLCACAEGVENNDMFTAECLMSHLRQMVSVSGEPLQRIGAYMLEGLVAKLASSGSSIYKALRCKEPASAELFSYMQILFEVCPYFKFGYMSANGAIAEAMKHENRIHIIDFQIGQGSQWVTLIQALATRPGGPPRVRITGIDDSTSAYARGGGLRIVGQRLCRLAESCKVPFEFHAVNVSPTEVELETLGIRQGEAIAVNFALALHHMPDESVGMQNHRDRLLRLSKSLSPHVVTLVEQEANTNTAPFVPRFVETMKHYLAIFESVDVMFPREHRERIHVEQHCLAGEIVNIVACEGAERVERHEPFGKWRSRFRMAGFSPFPLSSHVNAAIKPLMQKYSDKYTLEERDGALFLGWRNQPVIFSCAWR